jgi:ABC-type glycerol-3-phosphate transport system substrate-binding protein
MAKKITRRNMLRLLGAGAAGAALAACQPKTVLVEVEKVVKETVVVEQEKVIKETVIVEGTPKVVEKVVKETVVIEVEKEPPVSALGGKVSWETWRGPGTGWNEERMESFQAIHPEVEFEFLPMPWGDYAKMYAEAAAGDLADLVSFDPGHLVFGAAIENGLLLNWDELVAADTELDLGTWFEQFIKMQYYKGSLYGLPSWGWSGHDVLIANKKHFEELGIEAPAPDSRDTDMDTIGEWIRAFYKKGDAPGEVERWGANILIVDAAQGPIMRAYGGDILTEDGTQCRLLDDESVQGMKWLYDLAVVDQALGFPGDIPGNRATAWAEGKGTTMVGGGALDIVRTYRKQITDPEVAEPTTIYYPKRPDGKCPAWIMGGTWNINGKTESPQICYEFIKHLTTKEGCLGFNLVAGEGALVRPDTYQILKVRDEAYGWGEENLFNGIRFIEPANLRGQELRDAFNQNCQILMDRNQPIDFEQGMQQLYDAVQTVLDMPPA